MTIQKSTMIRREGQYYYLPHRRFWGVWVNHNLENGSSYGEFIKDFRTKEEAKAFVYEMNGIHLKNND